MLFILSIFPQKDELKYWSFCERYFFFFSLIILWKEKKYFSNYLFN